MSRQKVFALLFIAIVVIGMSAFGIRIWSQAGQFTTVKNLRTNACRIYGGIKAPEDIVIDAKTQTAFISSLDRRLLSSGGPGSSALRGSIRMLELAAIRPGAELVYKDVTPDVPQRFYPRGLSLYTGKDGVKRLFVINQAGEKSQSVEIFRIDAQSLVHEKTIDLGADIVFANNVLAVGPDSFYVTDSALTGVKSTFLNFSFQRKLSKIYYFDGKKVRVVADGFVMANGIAMSKNGTELYVTDTFSRSLRFFKRTVSNGALEDSGFLFIGTGLDNIDVAEDGSLWMAAHPKLIGFAMYLAGFKAKSSSQVIHAVKSKKGGGEVRTVYLDLGDNISGSSVAAAYGDNFIIGSSMDNKLAICAAK